MDKQVLTAISDAPSLGCALSASLSAAASVLVETVARLALVALLLVALAVRLVLVVALRAIAPPRAARFGRRFAVTVSRR